MAAGNQLNDRLWQEILSVDGVTDVLATRLSLHARFGTSISAEAGMCDMLTDADHLGVEDALVSGMISADAHSVLLGTNYQKRHPEMDVGAAMELSLGQESVTVTISGLFDPARMTNGHGALAMDSAALFAPETLFRKLHPEIEAFDYSWSIVNDPQKAERVESALEEILSNRSNLGLDTIGAHIEHEKMQSSLIFGGMRAISWLIFLFGVANLINTTLSHQMSRKRENRILRSIGLTRKQLCRQYRAAGRNGRKSSEDDSNIHQGCIPVRRAAGRTPPSSPCSSPARPRQAYRDAPSDYPKSGTLSAVMCESAAP